MTQPLLDQADSARRPFNAWFWVALVALVVMGALVFVLARRPGNHAKPAAGAEPAVEKPAAAHPAAAAAPAPAQHPAATRPVTVPVPAPATRPAPTVAARPTPAPAPALPAVAPHTEPVRTVAATVAPPPAPPPHPVPAPAVAPAIAPTTSAAPATAPAQPPSGAGLAALAEAKRLKDADDLPGARTKLNEVLDSAPDAATRAEAEDLLGAVNTALIFSPRPMPEKTDYTVQPGDSLDKIAKKFGTSIDLVRKGNLLNSAMIRVNQRLRVFSGSFRARVDKSDNTLTLLLNERFFKRYRVGTGQYSRTPVGTFKVTDKIAKPTWFRPDGKSIPFGDPENLLGTHWLALDVAGYGIHGTWDTNSIGKQSSAGCVRLLNSDVEELFALLPIGTPVTIED